MKRQALLDCIQAAQERYHNAWACTSVDLAIQVLPQSGVCLIGRQAAVPCHCVSCHDAWAHNSVDLAIQVLPLHV